MKEKLNTLIDKLKRLNVILEEEKILCESWPSWEKRDVTIDANNYCIKELQKILNEE
jgi:hypothetical protein